MKELLLAAAIVLLNVTISFATDGQWKTAGLSLLTAYQRINRSRSEPAYN
jgi:hypothetical protein